ncbi:MAG: hypothetical protein JXX14_16430 [Deltaproteobacteria bacterium]|nr:hypothetical protein [Deltaproteobacteria bacterium]
MSKSRLEIKELSIVLVGKFNPIIYHPQWMARKSILTPSEADAATENIKIIHQDVAEFVLDYCTIQVVKDRFSATSTQETHFKQMRDLVSNICSHLPECPILQAGINFHHHYRFTEEAAFNAFGHKVVPKEPLWKNFLEEPGLSHVAIQGKRTDGRDGYKMLHINSSGRVRPWGVQIFLNDHYQLYTEKPVTEADAAKAISVLNEQYTTSIGDSEKILDGIYQYGIS